MNADPATRDSERSERTGWLELVRGGRGVFTVLLNLAVIVHGVNTFVLSTVMPSVIADIGGAAYYAWPAMVYLIGTIVGASGGAPVRAALGRRRGYVASGLVFVAGSAVAALAPSMAILLAGQLLQGFGGGLLLSQSMALVREIYHGALRGRALAVINAAWVAAAMIGPAEAGFFAAIDWWRGAFWAAIPVAALVCALAWRYVGASGDPGRRSGFPLRRLALIAAAVMCVAAAGQIDSVPAGIALVIAACLLVRFTLGLDARSDNPIYPRRALSPFADIGAAYWMFMMLAFTQVAPAIFLPLLLGVLHDVPALWLGYYNMLMSIAWSAGSLAVAHVTHRGTTRWAILAGFAISTIGLAGMAAGVAAHPLWLLAIWSIVIGFGIGVSNVLAITWTMSIAARGEESLAASAIPALRSLGLAFGAAATGLVANAAGLGDATDPGNVTRALTAVFAFCALAPAVGLVMTVLSFAANARRVSG